MITKEDIAEVRHLFSVDRESNSALGRIVAFAEISLAAPQIDQAQRIARLERELAEARELARCGGWSK